MKWAYGAAKWHSCAKGWFRSYETPFEMAYWLRNSGSQGMESSQPFRSCKMALVCQGASSQLWKFWQRALGGCEMVSQQKSIFAARKRIFAAAPEACEIFSQWEAICTAAHFRLQNFAAQAFSLFLNSFWFLASFFQFPCNSSWFWSFKKIKLHTINTIEDQN